jgi:hypothetical protein
MTGGQGKYDLCIAASPIDPNLVFIGGINLWSSTDGGVTWKATSNWFENGVNQVVHADQHVLAFQTNASLFAGNDGGLYNSTFGGGVWGLWNDKSQGMIITQIYRIGVTQKDPAKVLIGNQDNGSKLFSTGVWNDVNGGDGMECIVDYSNSNYMYTSMYYGSIERSSDGYSSYDRTYITANIPGGQPTGFWVTPYIIDPVNPASLYFGFDRVWKTTSRGDIGSWSDISGVLSSAAKLRSIAMSPANTAIIYAADQTHVWVTNNANTISPPAVWNNRTTGIPIFSGYITNITVSNSDALTAWVTLGSYSPGQKVFQTTNGGVSWTNISGSLPNIPIMCIVQNNRINERNQLFIGTDVGVYAKDGTNDWIFYNEGMPNCVVTDLEFYYDPVSSSNDRLRAGTFARGLWETKVFSDITPVELSSFTYKTVNNSVKLEWITSTEINNNRFEIQRRNNNISWTTIGQIKGAGNSISPIKYSFIDKELLPNGKYTYRLKQIDYNGQAQYSKEIEAEIDIAPKEYSLLQNYPNPFNPSTTIKYELPKSGLVKLQIYSVPGQVVKTLINEEQDAGFYSVDFTASNLSSGIYFYKLSVNNKNVIKKMILLK